MHCPTCGGRFRDGCPTHGSVMVTAPHTLQPFEIADYRVIRPLGSGGFGAVYLAEGPEGEVAIKVAHANQALADARLLREAAALAAIGPPHVPRLFRTGKLADGSSYLVMELVRWPTLANVMRDRGPLSVPETLAMARGLLAAVAAAHALGLVHRDLKPENIFVGEGQVKLVDFGLVKQVVTRVHEASTGLTAAGAVLGSTSYMSPEQSAGRPDLDARSDLYSAGVIFYEMLAGRPPFLGSNADVLHAHIARRPPRLSTLAEVPTHIEDAIHRCLAKAAQDRFAGAAELLRALEVEADPAPRPQTGVAPAAAGAASPTRDKRTVAMLFFRSTLPTLTVQALLTSFAGWMARADGGYAVVFDHDSGDNPMRRALLAAEAVVARGLTAVVVVDSGLVTCVPRSDGGRRYMSPLFRNEACFPAVDDPPGVLITRQAAELVIDTVTRTIPGRDRLLLVREPDAAGGGAALIGRDREVAAVVEAARQAPAIVTFLAGPGLGKTALLAAAATALRATVSEVELIELRAAEPRGVDAGGTLRELARRVLALPTERPGDGGHALLAERLGFALAAELWPGVAVAMGWAEAGDPDVRAVAAAPGVLRATAGRAVGLGLRQLAADRKLVLLLDDAQNADAATLDALELASLEEGAGRLLVCVAARPSFAELRPKWGERAARHTRVELAPLEGWAAAELCRRLLAPAENIPAATIDRLVARTQGIPLLLTELCRGLKREGLVRRHEKGEGAYLASDALDAVPNLPLVEWLASRELAFLAPELARHARLLACLAPELGIAEVGGVLHELDRAGMGAELPLDARVATARLVESGLLVETGTRHAFRSGVLREAIERSTPAGMAQPIHEAAWRVLSAASDPEVLPALAYHAARSGRHRDAFATYDQIARRAELRHAYLDAELAYGRALEQAGHGETAEALAAAVRGRGLMRYRTARYADAAIDLRRARELAAERADPVAQIGILLDEAAVLVWQEEYHRSRDSVEQARALGAGLPGGLSPLLAARLTMAEGVASYYNYEWEAAARLLLDAAAASEGLGNDGYETFVIALLLGGYVLAELRRLDESEAAFARVIPLVAERGDQMHLGAALGNRSALWAARGAMDRTVADLSQVLEIARSIGNPRMEGSTRQMLAVALHLMGRSVEAEAHIRRGIEIDDRNNGASARAESRLHLARILAVRGDLAAAAEVLDEVRRRHAAAKARGSGIAELIPVEEVTWSLVELLVQGGSSEAWAALEDKARKCLTGADLEEVLRFASRSPSLRTASSP